MKYRVVITRRRLIEEVISASSNAPTAADAIASCQHLARDHIISWKYKRTLETSDSSTSVEANPKNEVQHVRT